MLITCPYCHKKLYASNRQLLLRGRLNMVCPTWRHYIFHALRKRLLVMQGVMMVAAVLICARMAQFDVPGGTLGNVALLLVSLALVVGLGELCSRWITRPAMLQSATDRAVKQEKEQEEAQKAAERKKKKHAKKK